MDSSSMPMEDGVSAAIDFCEAFANVVWTVGVAIFSRWVDVSSIPMEDKGSAAIDFGAH
jgi:hypothetical protein